MRLNCSSKIGQPSKRNGISVLVLINASCCYSWFVVGGLFKEVKSNVPHGIELVRRSEYSRHN